MDRVSQNSGSKRWAPVIILVAIATVALFAVPAFVGLRAPQSPMFDALQANTCNLTSNQNQMNLPSSTNSQRAANYDEQIGLDFNQNFSSLVYNVTAREQNDSYGFGPAYLLNGVTEAGYWYQTGISWNMLTFPYNHAEGFQFTYDVWDASNSQQVFPNNNGNKPISMNLTIDSGDTVELFLIFHDESVSMGVHDWQSNTTLQENYSAFNSSSFIPTYRSFPSGLMVEWYHVNPYFCTPSHVVFSNSVIPLSSGSFCVDEWNFTNVPTGEMFNASYGHEIVFNSCSGSCTLPQDYDQFQEFTADESVSYGNAYEFVVF